MSRLDPLVPPDDPWFGYANTLVEVVRPDAGNVVVAAAPAGEVGEWPWTSEAVIYVLTAWDPGEQRLSEEVNRARQAALEDDLRPRARSMLSARGVDPGSGYRDEGVAVSGVPEAAVLAAGARFGQDAFFAWTADEWTIVSCTGERRLSLGWSVTDSPAER